MSKHQNTFNIMKRQINIKLEKDASVKIQNMTWHITIISSLRPVLCRAHIFTNENEHRLHLYPAQETMTNSLSV